MKICHVSSFSPYGCGLYELSRDLARADIAGGHDVYFVDAGVTVDNVRKPGQVGVSDIRAGFKLTTCSPDDIQSCDIIVMHTGIEDKFLVKTQSPVIWIVHGRPQACFKPEYRSVGHSSYTLYKDISKWQRSKYMVYFWKEFYDHWKDVFPEHKHLIFDYPIVDENQFNTHVGKYKFQNEGDYNFVIADSNREDIDNYNLIVGCIKAAEQLVNLNIKFHFFGVPYRDNKIIPCWDSLLSRLKKYNALGDVHGRVNNIQLIYNAADCLISPNSIITRTIAESLCCGTPVITDINRYTRNMVDIMCNMNDADDIVTAIKLFIENKNNGKFDKNIIQERSKVFNLKNYYEKMNIIYEQIKLK